jgi:putative addiction module killer protein
VFSIRPLPEFTTWLGGLKDEAVRGVIVARIKRLERGLMGDVQPVGDGVSELRIHLGAGWRLYFTQRGMQVIVLLADGSKQTQKKDIKRAKALAALLDREENHEQTYQGR